MKKCSLIVIIVLLLSGTLFGQNSNQGVLKKLYSNKIIYKGEVSLFKKDEYNQIDHLQLLKTLQYSKAIIAKFIPLYEVVLYEQGNKTYTIYFSEKNKYFKIDGETFGLTNKDSKIVSEIFKNAINIRILNH